MSNLRVTMDNVGGSIAKEDERYTVTDNTALKDMVLSSTRLKPSCSTNGHEAIQQQPKSKLKLKQTLPRQKHD